MTEEAFENGKSENAKELAQEGRKLRNEGRVEDGKVPKTTKFGTGHPREVELGTASPGGAAVPLSLQGRNDWT